MSSACSWHGGLLLVGVGSPQPQCIPQTSDLSDVGNPTARFALSPTCGKTLLAPGSSTALFPICSQKREREREQENLLFRFSAKAGNPHSQDTLCLLSWDTLPRYHILQGRGLGRGIHWDFH